VWKKKPSNNIKTGMMEMDELSKGTLKNWKGI
jgi:hypothetical protein